MEKKGCSEEAQGSPELHFTLAYDWALTAN